MLCHPSRMSCHFILMKTYRKVCKPNSPLYNLSKFVTKVLAPLVNSCHCHLEGHPLQVRHKQDWGRGFILLLTKAAVLLRSDAGSDVIKPASSFVIQNHQT